MFTEKDRTIIIPTMVYTKEAISRRLTKLGYEYIPIWLLKSINNEDFSYDVLIYPDFFILYFDEKPCYSLYLTQFTYNWFLDKSIPVLGKYQKKNGSTTLG